MNLNVSFTEFFPATPDQVWESLTNPKILGDWLMPNDFVPEVGKTFTFVPDHPTPWDGNVECKVLELVTGKRMVWSWTTAGMDQPSRVEFELVPKGRGTELVFKHSGEADEPVAGGLKGGWPKMFAQLASQLKK